MIAFFNASWHGQFGCGGNLRQHLGDDRFGHRGVLHQVGDHHLHGDVRLVVLPAVVVGDHRHRRVGDLRFPAAFGLPQVGHADHVVAELAVGERLRARAEGRAFHVHVSPAVVDARLERPGGLQQEPPQFLANRVGERDVPDDAAAEEGVGGGLLGAVQELVGQHDVTGPVFRLERADGADADHPGHAELLHPPDVGAVIQFAGQNPVAPPVPGQKHHLAPRQLAGEEIHPRASRRAS